MYWALGILRHLRQAFRARVAPSFSCSQAESTPAHCPRTETVGWLRIRNYEANHHLFSISARISITGGLQSANRA